MENVDSTFWRFSAALSFNYQTTDDSKSHSVWAHLLTKEHLSFEGRSIEIQLITTSWSVQEKRNVTCAKYFSDRFDYQTTDDSKRQSVLARLLTIWARLLTSAIWLAQ